jgi:signal transduction histidine kinase
MIKHDSREPVALARIYAIASLIALLVAAFLLALLYRELSMRVVMEFGEQSNVSVATATLHAVLPELAAYLEAEEQVTDAAVADSVPRGLLKSIDAAVRNTSIERIKIYNRDGIVVFSTNKHEIGTDDRANVLFADAVSGQIRTNLRYRDFFNLLEPGARDDNLVETYVPVWKPSERRPVGVFEIYNDVDPMVRAMVRNEVLVFVGIAVILLVLYALLLLLVRNLGKTINDQQDTIVQRNHTLEVLSARMLAAEDTERRRVAWELHEEIAQTLSAVKLRIEALTAAGDLHHKDRDPPSLGEIVAIVQDAIRSVRALAMDLRPPALDDFGLIATTRWLCGEAEQVGRQLNVGFEAALQEGEIPGTLKGVIFRIIQQTLKHLVQREEISNVRVLLSGDGELRLSVEFDVGTEAGVKEGEAACCEHAIASIWERAVLSGGLLTRTPKGCRYEAAWSI